jgi:hypothetical protein
MHGSNDIRVAYKSLIEKPEGNKQLGRRRRRWKDNMKMDLAGIGRNMVVEWLTLLLRIREVSCSNLCPETGYHD